MSRRVPFKGGKNSAVADQARLGWLAGRLLGGRRFYLLALVPLVWPAFLIGSHAAGRFFGGAAEPYEPNDGQGVIGLPMAVLAIFLGVRVIAGELDTRRLEIAYTVPGGSRRVWFAKLLAAVWILLASEILLALATYAFFTSYPLGAFYGALQAAAFYLVLAMGLAALFKSEVTGAMGAMAVLAFDLMAGFGRGRFSPFWNPLHFPEADRLEVLGWTVQNRIGFALGIVALLALAFTRAERREKMLAG